MVKHVLSKQGVGSTLKARFDFVVQKIVKYGYARRGEVGLFSQADFFSVAERERFCLFG